MQSHQVEITVENILQTLVQMPENEFEKVLETAKSLRENRKMPFISAKESNLLLKINSIFPVDERERYNKLYAEFKRGKLTQTEHQELLALSHKFEMLNAERLELLGELAKIRSQSLRQVIEDLGIKQAR